MRASFSLAFLSLFLLLLGVRPAHAQGLPPGWSVQPCDAQGNPLPDTPGSDGFYSLKATQNTVAGNTSYPAPMIAAALSDPFDLTSNYGNYLGAGAPFEDSSDAPMPSIGVLGYAAAYNCAGNLDYYSVDPSFGSPSRGLINGSASGHTTGQMVRYFLVQWQGSGPAPTMPDHINLLLATNLWATATVNYATSPQLSGLSATATATDGPPFNETASMDSATLPVKAGLVGLNRRVGITWCGPR